MLTDFSIIKTIKKLFNAIGYAMLANLIFSNIAFSAIQVTRIDSPRYTSEHANEIEENACRSWQLSSADIIKIFEISTIYQDNGEIHRIYYWLPCEIKGKLVSDHKEWSFTINAAAHAEWNDGHQSLYWGCSKQECEPLFLLPYDGMAG